jgi:tetratricopeptide (TPR) repeat protein
MKGLFVLAGLIGFLAFSCARAVAQDDEYIQIYGVIQDADALGNSSQTGEALAKYIDAQTSLQRFQRIYPDWNRQVIQYRLNYLASRIAEISARTPVAATKTPIAAKPPTAAPPALSLQPREREDFEHQRDMLQSRVQQLQVDKMMLESKLKESLAAQPAAVDPRELAKAEEKIRSLEKENSLLQVSVAQQQTKAAPPVDTAAVEQMKRQLAETSQRLADQTKRADALAGERRALQTKLDSLIPAPWNATNLRETKKALEDANRKLGAQSKLASRLDAEKMNLMARVKSLEADSGTLVALRAENEILKKQLADLKRPAPAGSAVEVTRQLAEARARIAALESDQEIWRLEKIALENRVRHLMASSTAAPAPAPAPAATTVEDSSRVKQLERESADLRKKLGAAQKELAGRKARNVATKIEDLTGQLAILRARLAVFETQQIPYTEEEHALFKRTQVSLEAVNPRARQKSVNELPSGSATLVAEARNDFAAKRFDKAEEKYIQILHHDNKNVYTLSNLAAIQLELNHLDDAEQHIHQALAVSPDDSYSLLVLGQIKIRREQYDAALDALSSAAKVDPQNAEIQNYLGLTLSQKGLRTSAETAFRKAIELDPHYAGAHYNLAVFYITQSPPWPELARWHYKKAIDSGFPPNPDLEKMLGP